MNTTLQLYHDTAYAASRQVTQAYSSSFARAIRLLAPPLRNNIHAIYGFVRLADEIVDSFHGHDQESLLNRFEADVYKALDEQISLNPILHSFQMTARKFGIGRDLMDAFLSSMRQDLTRTDYDRKGYDNYIYGSADVVGLMCLRVFVQGDNVRYERLKPYAMRLGSAFQKVNFLRDIQHDYLHLNRSYFPGVDLQRFTAENKEIILKEIRGDFAAGLEGIRQLPSTSRFGVYTAYVFYYRLLMQLEATPASEILKRRLRVPDYQKILLVIYSFFQCKWRIA